MCSGRKALFHIECQRNRAVHLYVCVYVFFSFFFHFKVILAIVFKYSICNPENSLLFSTTTHTHTLIVSISCFSSDGMGLVVPARVVTAEEPLLEAVILLTSLLPSEEAPGGVFVGAMSLLLLLLLLVELAL